jgi:cysteine desulfurase
MLGGDPGGVVFTGSGSEANNLAIRGAILADETRHRPHVITQATEHPAVLATCRALHRLHGVEITCPSTATAWSIRLIWPQRSPRTPSSRRS